MAGILDSPNLFGDFAEGRDGSYDPHNALEAAFGRLDVRPTLTPPLSPAGSVSDLTLVRNSSQRHRRTPSHTHRATMQLQESLQELYAQSEQNKGQHFGGVGEGSSGTLPPRPPTANGVASLDSAFGGEGYQDGSRSAPLSRRKEETTVHTSKRVHVTTPVQLWKASGSVFKVTPEGGFISADGGISTLALYRRPDPIPLKERSSHAEDGENDDETSDADNMADDGPVGGPIVPRFHLVALGANGEYLINDLLSAETTRWERLDSRRLKIWLEAEDSENFASVNEQPQRLAVESFAFTFKEVGEASILIEELERCVTLLRFSMAERKRFKVVTEILETEVSYVTSLDLLVKVFLAPLRQRLTTLPGKHKEIHISKGKDTSRSATTLPAADLNAAIELARSGQKPLVSSADLGLIFGNIEHILSLHRTLLRDLNARVESWTNSGDDVSIADIFIKIKDSFVMYIPYMQGYAKGLAVLRARREKSKALVKFLDLGKQLCDLRGIEDFLIQPVQRIPRYILLLEELLKATQRSEELSALLSAGARHDRASAERAHTAASETAALVSAVSKTREIARLINNVQGEAESSASVVELARRLEPHIPNLVQPHRRLMRDGGIRFGCLTAKELARYSRKHLPSSEQVNFGDDSVMLDRSAVQTKERVVLLLSDMLLVCKADMKELTPGKDTSHSHFHGSHRQRRATMTSVGDICLVDASPRHERQEAGPCNLNVKGKLRVRYYIPLSNVRVVPVVLDCASPTRKFETAFVLEQTIEAAASSRSKKGGSRSRSATAGYISDKVISQRKILVFVAESSSDQQDWVCAIGECLATQQRRREAQEFVCSELEIFDMFSDTDTTASDRSRSKEKKKPRKRTHSADPARN